MPRRLKVDFYRTEDGNGRPIDIGPQIAQVAGLPINRRRVDFGDSFVLIHRITANRRLILGEVLKAKMNDLPEKVSRTTGVPADLGLNADEGVGRRVHFLYDRECSILLMQRDSDVRSPAFREGVAKPSEVEFHLSLVFKQDALNRLDRLRVVRKLSFRLARPQNPDALRGLDLSAGMAIDLLNEHGGLFIDVDISVGKSRHSSLTRDTVLRMARDLVGQRGADVRRIVVSGREEEDSATEIIDLFEDRLTYERVIEYNRRRLDREACDQILMEAHREHRDYLNNYRQPE